MSKRNSCWGIEVGAYAIKGVRLVVEGKTVRMAEYDSLPFKQVLTTPDLDANEAIQLGLDQFLSRHDVAHSSVMVSVPGHMALARFAKLPPVEPKKVLDIVRFEAAQQIPFPLEQVEWDYQVFAQEDSPDVEVGIFAITRERVGQFLANYRAVNLEIDGLTLSPLAMFNAMAYDLDLKPDSPGLVFLDIGTSSTDVVIVDGGRTWLRTLPIGGNNFTEALVRAFKLSFPKAEKLKREAATSKYARQIFQAMRPVFADLVQEVQRSLGFYQAMNRDAKLTRVIGLGSTFRLPGLQKFLKQQLQMDVDRPSTGDARQPGFARISAEGAQAADFADQALNLATAYGLALQGLGLAQVNANILPRAIVRQRMWRAKQPWFAAAAAVLLVAAGVAWWQLYAVGAATKKVQTQNETAMDGVQREANPLLTQLGNVNKNDRPRQMQEYMQILPYRNLGALLYNDLVDACKAVISPENPQSQLDQTDYAQIAKVPRAQRRRVVIEHYDMAYLDAPLPEGWNSSGQLVKPWNQAISDLVGLESGTPGFGGGGAAPAFGARGTAPAGKASSSSGTTGHCFLVTIQGYLPYVGGTEGTDNAVSLLSVQLMGYLRRNARRADRPYILQVSTDKIEQSRYGMTGPTRPGRGTFGGPEMFGPPAPYGPGPEMMAPGAYGRPGARPGGATGPEDWRSYLPANPLSDEDRSQDTVFTIQWVVQLESPALIQSAMVEALSPRPEQGRTPPATPRAGTRTHTPARPAKR